MHLHAGWQPPRLPFRLSPPPRFRSLRRHAPWLVSAALFAGTIVVRTNERSLYFVMGNSKAMHYPVGVGRIGRQWTGTAMITGKHLQSAWSPPPRSSARSRAARPDPGRQPQIRWAPPR